MTGNVSLTANEISVSETQAFATVSFSRRGDLSGPVTITYEVTAEDATPGLDYTPLSGTIRIPAGAKTASIQVPILNDSVSEVTESFVVSVLAISSGTLLAPRTTRVSILDDENPVIPDPEPALVSDYIVTEVPVATVRAHDIDFYTDKYMFVAQRDGVIRVFDLETDTFLPDFVNIRSEVRGLGLMNIALHPDFPENPYVYAYYTVDPPDTAGKTGLAGPDGSGNRFQWLVRFEADPATGFLTAKPNSKVVLLGGAGQSLDDISGGGAFDFGEGLAYANLPASDELNRSPAEIAAGLPYRQNYLKGDGAHVGGGIAFGPDGMLYLATGDGVAFNYTDPRTYAVQDLDSLSGKVLRIDPITGRGLADNPFHEAGDSLDLNRSKVYQYGLRNPFSIGFSRDGELMVSDTGRSSYEEINKGPAGANFGWPFYEGADAGRLYTSPVWLPNVENRERWDDFLASGIEITTPFRGFSHRASDPGFQFQAVTGGDVDYDGNKYPDSLQGRYFFSDFSDGDIFVVDWDNGGDVKFLYHNEGTAPVYFTQGPGGYVYYVDPVSNEVGYLEIREIPSAGPVTIGAAVKLADVRSTPLTVNYGAGVELENPVVFASPVSRNGIDPVTIEFTRIGDTSATLFLQEPDYRDGLHGKETASLLAFEAGVWEVGDGRQLEVGTVTVPSGAGFVTVAFDRAFDAPPVILTQIQTDGGDPEWAVVRARNITATSFQLRIQEEEANDGVHATTIVGYLALEGGAAADVFEWNGIDVQAFSAKAASKLTPFALAAGVGASPIIAASLTSFLDTDPANLRAIGPTNGSVSFRADEEKSLDTETFHRAEDVDGLAFAGGGVLTGIELA